MNKCRPAFSLLPAMLAAFCALLQACNHYEAQTPPEHKPSPLSLQYPAYFPLLDIPEHNPQTLEGTALGKMLYYDTRLSSGGPQQGKSCASCHRQQASFSLNSGGTAVLPHQNLSPRQKAELAALLKTRTDEQFIANPDFGDAFKRKDCCRD